LGNGGKDNGPTRDNDTRHGTDQHHQAAPAPSSVALYPRHRLDVVAPRIRRDRLIGLSPAEARLLLTR
jgi:hypothetical protein